MTRETILLRRIRITTIIFIFGLSLSGLTAIPLVMEMDFLTSFSGPIGPSNGAFYTGPSLWLAFISRAVKETQTVYPQLFYGTDWLAFGHIVISIAFFGAVREPVRNRWLFDFGLIACALVVPWAIVFGALRGIPLWWRLIDCSFGVFGSFPLFLCRRWVRELETCDDASNVL